MIRVNIAKAFGGLLLDILLSLVELLASVSGYLTR